MCPIIARIMFLHVLRACMQHGLPLAMEGVGVFRRFRRWVPRVYSNQSHKNVSYSQGVQACPGQIWHRLILALQTSETESETEGNASQTATLQMINSKAFVKADTESET